MHLPKPTASPHSSRTHARYLKARRGMQLLGAGAFARVYGRANHRRVVKIGETWDSYLKYVKMIGLQSDNPYFPRIHDVKINRHENRDYYVIEMEKLIKWGNVPKKVRDAALEKLGARDLWDANYLRIKEAAGELEREAIKLLQKLWYRGTSRDVHRGNVMFRKRGRGYQLVFTDPAA